MVYAKPQFGGPERVLRYLSRYTHRVAIANHRLLCVGNGIVRFRWKDSADHNASKELPLKAEEFLRRFLLHVLPRGFMRIRHYGVLANRHRHRKLTRCRQLLDRTLPVAATAGLDDNASHSETDADTRLEPTQAPCPICGGPMRVVEILTPQRRDTS